MFKQNNIAEIKIRAERRAGEMLRETERNTGGQAEHKSYQSHDVTSSPKLSDIGINKNQSSRWQGIASLPEKEFEEHIIKTKADKKESLPCNITKKPRKWLIITDFLPIITKFANYQDSLPQPCIFYALNI